MWPQPAAVRVSTSRFANDQQKGTTPTENNSQGGGADSELCSAGRGVVQRLTATSPNGVVIVIAADSISRR